MRQGHPPTWPARYAEDVGHYWKTSRTDPGAWLGQAAAEIVKAGGEVFVQAEGQEPRTGRSAFLVEFCLMGDRFRAVWPVLASRTGDHLAARRQAATALFYEVKARCMSAKMIGARAAFFAWLVLTDGRSAQEHAEPELETQLPGLLRGSPARLLPAGTE